MIILIKQISIKKNENKDVIEREKECEVTDGKKDDFERMEGGDIVRVGNRSHAKKGKNKI